MSVAELPPDVRLTPSNAQKTEWIPTPTPFVPLPSPTALAQTDTPALTPVSTETPIPLGIFSPRLNKGIIPVPYLQDTCRYLADRWNPQNAKPGTIVVPIMYHGIRKEGGSINDNITVSEKYFKETMQHAVDLGFQTITMEQLAAFLQHNAYIPPRSLLLIIDDRRLGTVRNHFLPVLQQNNWTMVMAYITGVADQREWREIKSVLETGRVEIQAHGFLHNGSTYFTENTPAEIIHNEIYAPITTFEENLGYRPIAFIWPGGNFTPQTVVEVRKAGYQLGFTAYARGPILFNWIPQGEPERSAGDPLLLLPRYWSTAAYMNLDQAVELGQQAADYARQNQQTEMEWYNRYCGANYPPLSSLAIPAEQP
ncbi:predicted xylanase/chitin deacetylase [Bellilinea caldifistulae]|nr:polysaccharide deacetylase family protein [Bellilinea caldifistulae]GAP10234.1 predicted xylanase/chitin deacetylase [Bellilinea caldifistulae]